MKYRIKEVIYKNGNSCYQIQSKFLFVWQDYNPPLRGYHFDTLSQARTKLQQLRDMYKFSIKYHY